MASGVGQLALREENGLLETFPSMCGSSTPAPSCQEEEGGERRREEEGGARRRGEEEERKRREEEERKEKRRRGGGKGGEKKRRREAARSRSSGGRIQKISRSPIAQRDPLRVCEPADYRGHLIIQSVRAACSTISRVIDTESVGRHPRSTTKENEERKKRTKKKRQQHKEAREKPLFPIWGVIWQL